ncbi:hypothetical protein EC973_005694 [Apophysomyces ossiformis]|uniref:Sterol regulatory element-binding protein cleavage-activating protein n=1 Tax=Apophysomyces ossiformis TaxID=679940 RepID=A0A8H7BU49_9FUNG|nr:hypothetical protein EC973_005694 [Apophysomyces ossiformis]
MPLLALQRLRTHLSTYFYPYGKACASHTTLLLFFSLTVITLLSYPVVLHRYNSLGLDLTRSVQSDQVDAQFWQFSPHLQLDNASHARSKSLTVQQIRIAAPSRQITKDLLTQTLKIQNTLTTTFVYVDGKPASLSTICLAHRGLCIVHSPLDFWHNSEANVAEDEDLVTTINEHIDAISDATGLAMHPLSLFGNVTLDNRGRFASADSVILTIFLHQTSYVNANRIWDSLWTEVSNELGIANLVHGTQVDASAWQKQVNTHPQILQYKLKLFPYDLPSQAYLVVLVYLAVCLVVSLSFGRAHLLKSRFGLGFAAAFMSLACFVTALGILFRLGIELHLVPWYVPPLITIAATVENVFLLTNAALSSGCDMQVKEKIGRALQSIGIPMTATLFAELTILGIGRAMDIAVVKEFCLFTTVVLLVEYFMQLTFYISVLAIDVRRAELADLEDRELSKRLHEIANCDIEVDPASDYCPVQDPPDGSQPKSCSDCKQFRTHRAFNALLVSFLSHTDKALTPVFKLCLVILTFGLFRSYYPHRPTTLLSTTALAEQTGSQLLAVSSRFWGTVNPLHETEWLQINPTQIIFLSNDLKETFSRVQHYEDYYEAKALALQLLQSQNDDHTQSPPTLRTVILETVHWVLLFILSINLPSLILCIVLIGIITWMMPRLRERWLMPLLKRIFVIVISRILYYTAPILPWKPTALIRRVAQELKMNDYSEDGVHHGAISAQKQFRQQQKRNITNVRVRTLTGKHVADIRRLHSNAKEEMLVSCGQDGRLVLWDAKKGKWLARLDRLRQNKGGAMEIDFNPELRPGHKSRQSTRKAQVKRLPAARCAKIDQGNKWIAAGYDDGAVRVWNMILGQLARELHVDSEIPVVMEEEGAVHVRRRKTMNIRQHHRGVADRVIALQFIGAVAEYCHPLVAEAAARQGTIEHESQNYIVSVHKSGLVREWDIISGECIQSFPSGCRKDITRLCVVECKTPHRKTGVTWVFVASKDGIVKCWERKLERNSNDESIPSSSRTRWTCAYTLDGHDAHPITALAAELSVGSVGILVTGSSDGAVKVWNMETGEAICTLSAGGMKKTKTPEIHIGGPLLKFSKISEVSHEKQARADDQRRSRSCHRGSITQVVITRYCDVESMPDQCRGCDTCFGNGFLIASCAVDDMVHVWRLERSNGHHDNRALCSVDYHLKQYRRVRTDVTEANRSSSPKPKRPRQVSVSSTGSVPSRLMFRHIRPSRPVRQVSGDDGLTDGLVDIEQLGGDNHTALIPSFLGTIDQLAGRDLVFCENMVLAGVRQKRTSDGVASNQWEVWFASLQYQESALRIPVETHDLDHEPTVELSNNKPHVDLWGSLLREGRYARHVAPKVDSDEEDLEEAHEILPFSTIRHVVPLGGYGLSCDFGNFVKLVNFEDRRKQVYHDRSSSSPSPAVVADTDCGADCGTCASGQAGQCPSEKL